MKSYGDSHHDARAQGFGGDAVYCHPFYHVVENDGYRGNDTYVDDVFGCIAAVCAV